MTDPTADYPSEPPPGEIECLACGTRRLVASLALSDVGECAACGYSGWALPQRLSEHDRNALHAGFAGRRTP
jgi:hypothetical protein